MSKKPLDIGAIKKATKEQQSAGTFEKRPFLFVRDPEKGKPDAAYRIQIDGAFRQYVSKEAQRTRDALDVIVLEVVNDSEAPKGAATIDCTRKVLKNKLSTDGKGTTAFEKGKVFDVMCLGKVKGKDYYDYAVLPVESTLRAPSLILLARNRK